LIGTGVALEVPEGYDAEIRPRSGLSAKGVAVVFETKGFGPTDPGVQSLKYLSFRERFG